RRRGAAPTGASGGDGRVDGGGRGGGAAADGGGVDRAGRWDMRDRSCRSADLRGPRGAGRAEDPAAPGDRVAAVAGAVGLAGAVRGPGAAGAELRADRRGAAVGRPGAAGPADPLPRGAAADAEVRAA